MTNAQVALLAALYSYRKEGLYVENEFELRVEYYIQCLESWDDSAEERRYIKEEESK